MQKFWIAKRANLPTAILLRQCLFRPFALRARPVPASPVHPLMGAGAHGLQRPSRSLNRSSKMRSELVQASKCSHFLQFTCRAYGNRALSEWGVAECRRLKVGRHSGHSAFYGPTGHCLLNANCRICRGLCRAAPRQARGPSVEATVFRESTVGGPQKRPVAKKWQPASKSQKAGIPYSRIAAMPGRSLPSRASSIAPPPVET